MSETLLGNIKGPKGDKGETGERGPQGETGATGATGEKGDPFTVKKTYASVADMEDDFDNDEVIEGDFVMIASNPEDEDNAKLYVKGETAFTLITDLSGARGMKGETGAKGDTGATGATGEQGPKGDDGITPTLRLDADGNLYVSYDSE